MHFNAHFNAGHHRADCDERCDPERDRRNQLRAQREDFEEAHAQGLHAEVPREGCPECESQHR